MLPIASSRQRQQPIKHLAVSLKRWPQSGWNWRKKPLIELAAHRMNTGVEQSSMVAMVFLLVLALLNGALLILKRMARKKDVIQGDYVKKVDEE
jgi:hypothetical protein